MKSKVKSIELKKEEGYLFIQFIKFENGASGYFTTKDRDYFKEGEVAEFSITIKEGKSGLYNEITTIPSELTIKAVELTNQLLINKIIDKSVFKETAKWYIRLIKEL